jgi:hypothetical protein
VTKKQQATATIRVDAAELLKTPTTIDFAKLPSVTDALNATTIADNCRDMFQWIGEEHEE